MIFKYSLMNNYVYLMHNNEFWDLIVGALEAQKTYKNLLKFQYFTFVKEQINNNISFSFFERCKKRDFEIMRFSKDVEQKSRISMIIQGGLNRKY